MIGSKRGITFGKGDFQSWKKISIEREGLNLETTLNSRIKPTMRYAESNDNGI